jgi:hypothetical protein
MIVFINRQDQCRRVAMEIDAGGGDCRDRRRQMEVLDVSTRLGDEAGLMPFLFSYGTLQQEDVQLSTFGR